MPRSADLVASVSIDQLLQQRDDMVKRIRDAHRLLAEADELAGAMFQESYRGHRLDLMTSGTRRAFTVPGGDEQLVKEVDGRAWQYLLEKSGLQTFLDAEARKKWRDAIDKNDVPELTRANIEATFTSLYDARGEMFERGVVAVFRQLSWDYKTNNPRMFGKRLILKRIVDTWGTGRERYVSGVSHNGANELDDLIRVMSVLDGKPEPDHRQGVWYRLSEVHWMRNGNDAVQVADLGYFTVRGFKNGNGHLTFARPDLVDKLNLIIAKHFPHVLAPAEAEAHAA